MTFARLLAESLLYHGRTNAAVLLGCAVGTAVLTGALLVGDSMRGSLRAMTLERLGGIDQALIGGRFFTQGLADKLAQSGSGKFVPVIVFTGAVEKPKGDLSPAPNAAGGNGPNGKQTAPQVNIIGVPAEFWDFFPDTDALRAATAAAGNRSNICFINQPLAERLGTAVDGELVVRVEKPSAIPRENLLGGRDYERVLRAFRLKVAGLVPLAAGGRFTLQTSQQVPLNLYVPLPRLAELLDQPDAANGLLAQIGAGEAGELPDRLRAAMTLADYGLTLKAVDDRYLLLENKRLLIEPSSEAAVQAAVDQTGAKAQRVLTYLVDTITLAENPKRKAGVPYSVVTTLDPASAAALQLPVTPDAAGPADGECWLNQWTVDQLGAKVADPQSKTPGDEVVLHYRMAIPGGGLEDRTARFRLTGVVAMTGLGIDQRFTPDYPGISDKTTFADWDAPFPLDLKRIDRKVDEKYWEEYRTTPKVFLSLADGRRLFTSRFGETTSVRIVPPAGKTTAEFMPTLERALLDMLCPPDLGFSFLPVKGDALQASVSGTDFGVLFLAFSMFLIASAALLVGLLFRLSAERRAAQLGLLLALGYRAGTVRWLLLSEGLLLAAVGGLLGLAGALFYAQAMIAGLKSVWADAVNVPFIDFHATPTSLAIGWFASLVIALFAIGWAVGRLGRVQIPLLLRPGFTFASSGLGQVKTQSGRLAPFLAVAATLAGIGLIVASPRDQVGAFFGGGALLLVGGLAAIAVLLRSAGNPARGTLVQGGGWRALGRLGIRNGGRYPARSLLTAAAIAFATFVVVSVGAMRHEPHDDRPALHSGNGGIAVLARFSIPAFRDLDHSDGRFDIGIPDDLDAKLAATRIYSCRLRTGDDASCLNIYRPRTPTLVGVPDAFVERGGFAFAASLAETDAERANPWLLLQKDYGPGVLPAIADDSSLRWILQVDQVQPVGKTLVVRDGTGTSYTLKFVAALAGSCFQSEVLVGESALLREFPDVTGYQFFLIEDPSIHAPSAQTPSVAASSPEREPTQMASEASAHPPSGQPAEAAYGSTLARELENALDDYGVTAETPQQRIAAFKAVEHTYMGAFETLGGLGLVLGTLGLATVLLRNVLERQGELGLLRALGFSNAAVAWLVLAENAFLLVAGVALGTVCGLLAVLPQLLKSGEWAAFPSLAATLGTVLVVGLLSGLLAVAAALRLPIVRALRAE